MKVSTEFPTLIVKEGSFVDPLFPNKKPQVLEVSFRVSPTVIQKLRDDFNFNAKLLIPAFHLMRVRAKRSQFALTNKTSLDLKEYADTISQSLKDVLADMELSAVGAEFCPCYYPDQLKFEWTLRLGNDDNGEPYNPKDLAKTRVLH